MTISEVLAQLKASGIESLYRQNKNRGIVDPQYGVKMGDLRTMAAKIKMDQKLAFELWDSGIFEARMLAILLLKPQMLTGDQITEMVSQDTRIQVTDWFSAYIIKNHPEKDELRTRWMQGSDIMCLRAGWSLTAGTIPGLSDQSKIRSILNQIEHEMPRADPKVQWTMNFALAYIGIHHPDFRDDAIALGEKLGAFRDYPVSKGCTSPFAPIWIREMVKRQEKNKT